MQALGDYVLRTKLYVEPLTATPGMLRLAFAKIQSEWATNPHRLLQFITHDEYAHPQADDDVVSLTSGGSLQPLDFLRDCSLNDLIASTPPGAAQGENPAVQEGMTGWLPYDIGEFGLWEPFAPEAWGTGGFAEHALKAFHFRTKESQDTSRKFIDNTAKNLFVYLNDE